MRRGGVLILLIGLILIVGAVMLFLFVQNPQNPITGGGPELQITQSATEVPLVNVVIARRDIAANTVISQTSLLETKQIPQTAFDQKINFSNSSEVVGKLAVRLITAEQPIMKDDLTEPGLSQQIPTAEAPRPRDKAYPFIVNNLSGVSDQIKPGDFVDVVATFNMLRRYSYPSNSDVKDVNGVQVPVLVRQLTDPTFNATKTIVQRAQVIKIIKPQVAAPDTTPEAGNAQTPAESSSLPKVDESGQPIKPGTNQTSGTITQGAWTLILAVDDQEIELMEFALATNSRMVLVLRGAGDGTFEPTIGATFDLLVSEFGVPLPQQLPPNVISEQQAFTPEPTRTPAPTRVP
jgi:pilus assembly protein CpaB